MSVPTYALFGSPIDRSPSPAMHGAAFAALGVDARYALRPAEAGEAAALVAEIRDGRWRGANVTTPLKVEMAEQVSCTGDASRAGAVNTLYWDGAALLGALTDVEGIVTPLKERGVGVSETGAALIVGAGGAARAAVLACDALGLSIRVAARDGRRARAMLDAIDIPSTGGAAFALGDRAVVTAALGDARVVINATPVGRSGERLPLPWASVPPGAVAFEMTYAPRRTPFLDDAEAQGCAVVEGWEMLLAQGAASFTLWTGRPAPVGAMRAAVLQHLRGA